MKKDIALYLHYPFCLKKCNYCDFVSIAGSNAEGLENAYFNSFEQHKELLGQSNIKTFFIGGGTPSLISENLLTAIFKKIDLSACDEISIEINPATVDENKMRFFKDIGINRISIGIQALNDDDLKVMGRLHSSKQALETIDIAKKYFKNISADFIYGRPNQSSAMWKKELNKILSLDLPHLSMYQLTIENGWKVELPSDDECEKMFIINHRNSKNYNHYEISNFAKNGFESKHNLAYWHYQNYLGIGPSAHSRVNGKAIIYENDVKKWLHSQNFTEEILDEKEAFYEKILMGLRLAEGIDITYLDSLNQQKASMFINNGYLEIKNDKIYPTLKGMLLNNYIIETIL